MKAVLDANLFFSAWITDPLLTFAEEGFYEPIWSERILAEVKEHLPQVWSSASLEDTNRYVSMIQAAFPEAMTKNWQRYELPYSCQILMIVMWSLLQLKHMLI